MAGQNLNILTGKSVTRCFVETIKWWQRRERKYANRSQRNKSWRTQALLYLRANPFHERSQQVYKEMGNKAVSVSWLDALWIIIARFQIVQSIFFQTIWTGIEVRKRWNWAIWRITNKIYYKVYLLYIIKSTPFLKISRSEIWS